jgi:hypothetical protein
MFAKIQKDSDKYNSRYLQLCVGILAKIQEDSDIYISRYV